MNNIRKIWFRVLVVLLVLIFVNVINISVAPSDFRLHSLKALLSITVIFAISSALSLGLYFNYVKGLRAHFLGQVRLVRKKLWKFYEENKDSTDSAVQNIINDHIVPLLRLSHNEWLQYDKVLGWGEDIDKPILEMKVCPDYNVILFKHLLPIEDELNELGLLLVRSICSPIITGLSSGVFILISVAISVIILGYILPNLTSLNLIIANMSIAICCYAVLELIHIMTFFNQEAREELVIDTNEGEKA